MLRRVRALCLTMCTPGSRSALSSKSLRENANATDTAPAIVAPIVPNHTTSTCVVWPTGTAHSTLPCSSTTVHGESWRKRQRETGEAKLLFYKRACICGRKHRTPAGIRVRTSALDRSSTKVSGPGRQRKATWGTCKTTCRQQARPSHALCSQSGSRKRRIMGCTVARSGRRVVRWEEHGGRCSGATA